MCSKSLSGAEKEEIRGNGLLHNAEVSCPVRTLVKTSLSEASASLKQRRWPHLTADETGFNRGNLLQMAKVLPICTTRHVLCAEGCVAFVKDFGHEKH